MCFLVKFLPSYNSNIKLEAKNKYPDTIARLSKAKKMSCVLGITLRLLASNFPCVYGTFSGVAKMWHTDLHRSPTRRQQYSDEEGSGYLPLPPAH